MKRLRMLSPAEAEMLAAAKYYESQSAGLGHRFLDEVARLCASIVEVPNAGTVLRKNVRRRIMKRFPFSVLYILETTEIQILAVVDMRRNPDYWVSRA